MPRVGHVPAALTTRGRLLWMLVVLGAVSLSLGVGLARASGYWNVWQGNLPGADGQRAKYSVCNCQNAPIEFYVRLSWTSTHSMNFSWILADGSWTNLDAITYSGALSGNHDRVYGYYGSDFGHGGAVQGGCENPAGLSVAYTNCRNDVSF